MCTNSYSQEVHDGSLYFDAKTTYDVVFMINDGTFGKIEDIEVVGCRDIFNKSFFVYRKNRFVSKKIEDQGYILFNTIVSIFPHGHNIDFITDFNQGGVK